MDSLLVPRCAAMLIMRNENSSKVLEMNDGFILTSVWQSNISWCIPNLLEFKEVS